MFTLFLLGITILGIIVHSIASKKPLALAHFIEIILLYLLVINAGIGGLYSFIGHAFLADEVAKSIGWPSGNPFQSEIAAANLAFGIIGILCIWFRGGFWLAAGIGYSVFLLGAAYVHFTLMAKGDYALNNTGPLLYIGDILIPVLMLVFVLIYYFKTKKELQAEA